MVETVCVIVHEPPAGMTPALNPTVVPPLTPPVSVALPPAVHATPPAAALVRPAGYASEIVTPVRFAGLAAGLETMIVIVAVPPDGMEVGAKAFVTVGALRTTVSVGRSPPGARARVGGGDRAGRDRVGRAPAARPR